MSVLATRLLVLGVVRIFEPANAYQLRRELLSWEVQHWANVNPGSIYSMLGTFAKQGLVDAHELEGENGRPVTVYTTTATGRERMREMLLEAVGVVRDSADPVDLRAAMSFVPMLRRGEFLEALLRRLAALEEGMGWVDRKMASLEAATRVPPHVVYEFGLETALVRTQIAWLEQAVRDVDAGRLEFADDESEHGGGWTPDDDPGWRMIREREHYLSQLEG